MGLGDKVNRAKGKVISTWRSPHHSFQFKLNWTLGHLLRLTGLVLYRLTMMLLDPASIRRIGLSIKLTFKTGPSLLKKIFTPKELIRKLKIYWFSIRPTYKANKPMSNRHIQGEDVTVILPVYGQIQIVRYLLNQLEAQQKAFPFKLVVIDDAYDEYSTKWLRRRLSKWEKSELVAHSKNIGYLKSINSAVALATTKYVVLLNSDVELNSQSIERLTAPLLYPGVALATALATDSGANLSLDIPKGRHWVEVDNWLKEVEPKYPPAHTAIGYALAINLELVSKNELFSNDFSDGYGEDSDLHFRAIELGYKSVIVDNLLVRHHSGISYGLKEDVEHTKRQNMNTFMNKWKNQHSTGLKKWESRNPLHQIQGYLNNRHKIDSLSADLLVLIPSLDDHSGGSRMVVALFEELWRSGLTARIVSTIRDLHRSSAWTATTEGRVSGSSFRVTVTTGSGTFDKGTRLAKRFDSKKALFFQGPEMFFDNGAYFGTTIKHLKQVDSVFCGTPYLAQLAETFGASNSASINLGPDIDQFYRDKRIEKTNKVLISSRLNVDKGTIFSVPLALHFLRMGYQVETFGYTTDALKLIPGIKHHGQVSAKQMNTLMNQAKYLVDTSIFEGLGLTPLEALRAECVPIVTRKGGLESINPPRDWMLWLDSPYVSYEELSDLLRSYEEKPPRSTSDLDDFFQIYNIEAGIGEAATHLGKL